MYSMVIADDELMEQKALKLLLQKEFPDIKVEAVVSNGIEMVSAIMEHRPDMAIVDVDMPGMNGIDSIDLLKRDGSIRTKFIINTAYSEFSYAQRALALKIDAYILKPEKQGTTIATLRRICKEIDKSRLQQQSEQQLNQLFTSIRPIVESEIMYSIFVGDPAQASFAAWCEMHAAQFVQGTIATIMPLHPQEHAADRSESSAALHAALRSSCTYMLNVARNNVCLLLFVPQPPGAKTEQWLRDVLSLAVQSLGGSEKYAVGVGNIYGSFEQMHDAYRESLDILKGKAKPGLYFYHKGFAAGNTGRGSEEAGLPMEANAYVRNAVAFVEKNFQQDISLEMAAQHVGISSYYLSRQVSQALGITFMEFLTKIRMEHAIHLVKTTELPQQEIAQRAGYQNPIYFARVFKKYTGKTVGELREGLGE